VDRRVIDVVDVTTRAELGAMPIIVTLMCGLLGACDGPRQSGAGFLRRRSSRPSGGHKMPAFVPVFTVGLIGLMVGSFVGGWFGDRFGRKKALLIAALCFGVTTFLTPWCTTLQQLMIVRFVGGLGIGGLPSALAALIAETVPERSRATLTLWALVGIPFGGFVGGFAASWMIPAYGWQSVFYAAGAVSIVVLLLFALLVSESTHFLTLRGQQRKRVAAILGRLDPKGGYTDADEFVLPPADQKITSVAALFTESRGRMTLLFWGAEIIELMIFYVLVNWTPTLFREAGIPIERAVLGTAALNMGAILATIALGPVCARFGEQRVTAATFVVTSVALLVMVAGAGNLTFMMVGVFFAGAGCIGGQAAVVMLMAKRYPTAIRSLGVGWALTVGRIGSIISPTVVGLPLAWGWSSYQILMLPIVPSLLGALCVALAHPVTDLSGMLPQPPLSSARKAAIKG
jgi:AAHS family 4-hydroxybenzoate transporter-like MFS transporter